MQPLVLTVDMAGLPQAWVELEDAITYHAKQLVAWSVGSELKEFRGGWRRDGSAPSRCCWPRASRSRACSDTRARR